MFFLFSTNGVFNGKLGRLFYPETNHFYSVMLYSLINTLYLVLGHAKQYFIYSIYRIEDAILVLD